MVDEMVSRGCVGCCGVRGGTVAKCVRCASCESEKSVLARSEGLVTFPGLKQVRLWEDSKRVCSIFDGW